MPVNTNSNHIKAKAQSTNVYPFFGDVSCGLFGISDDFVESYLSLDQKFMKNKESTFFVRASGDSMSPDIKNNDILVVDRSRSLFSGAIVAFYLNGTPMCKEILELENCTYLKSFNSSFKTILISSDDEFVIFGIVVGIVRDPYDN
ncbi:MAG: DNA polymerase V subunit UmuD [Halobacteriovoraceae bacterium]|jgi:DNA polymerase V|nr:DNA polymerase V subunit UmuD [Halobacteriovoraceae bacterium]